MINEKAQAEYEAKLAALHKNYKKLRWGVRLVWLIYFIISMGLLIYFLYDRNIGVFWVAVLINGMGSIVMMSYFLKLWQQQEQKQEQQLIEQAPIGKIRLGHDE